MNNKVVLVGAGGFCSGVIDSIQKANEFEIVGITEPNKTAGELVCGVKVIGSDSKLKEIFESGTTKAFVTIGSIGNYSLRKRLIEYVKSIGFELISVVDPSSQVSSFVELGEMVYVGKNAVINSDVKIGNYAIINTSSVVEHGCSLGDYVHVAPASSLAGDIDIGPGTHVGINATIIQGLTIGKDCMIGAGSTVLGNVENDATVYGIVKGDKI